MMRVEIEGNEVVVRLTVDALVSATERGPALDDLIHGRGGNESTRVNVTDRLVWVDEFIRELRREEEDGTTLLHRAFDAAISRAVDSGAFGLSISGIDG